MNQDALKQQAAAAAIDALQPGQIVGVGTGSTVNYFIDLLAQHRGAFPLAVSSSEASTARLRKLGIEVIELNEVLQAGKTIPVYVDGADEITDSMAMIKGGGAALTREKVLAAAAQQFVCIADRSKRVKTLGRFPLPIEVVPMSSELIASNVRRLGAKALLREGVVTDNGNQIIDVHGLQIEDPVGLETLINQWPGVVTVGLFAHRGADIAFLASADGIDRRVRE